MRCPKCFIDTKEGYRTKEQNEYDEDIIKTYKMCWCCIIEKETLKTLKNE